MPQFHHRYPFDPCYGYELETLLTVPSPPSPPDFAEFWQKRYQSALSIDTQPRLTAAAQTHPDYDVLDLTYRSTDDLLIGGWLLRPRHGCVRRGLVIGHGYGGREAPDFDIPVGDAALLFPCVRGISRSRHPPISDNPAYHVLHDIHLRDRYILGGCVEDLWLAVSTLLHLLSLIHI